MTAGQSMPLLLALACTAEDADRNFDTFDPVTVTQLASNLGLHELGPCHKCAVEDAAH